mmetsp:Transcript_11321/g.47300  ORF Transcript_11321/g.47300 Transcript_11321/m.47300 type:complete len:313 (-) Transcript_11321:67-1005(-)|eukprot:PRCOL_00007231-RA
MGSWWRSPRVVVPSVLLTVVAFLVGFSLRKLDPLEYGLAYDVHAKTLADDAQQGGLHAGTPGFRFIKYPSTYLQASIPDDTDHPERLGTCVSRDGLRVIIRVEFQYQILVEDIEEVTRKYRNQERWKRLVVTKAVSAVQKGCSLFFTSSFQAERGVIQERMLEALIEKLADVHALAVGLQLSFVELPAEYSKAVAAKQAANEDIGLAINQREQQRTIAEQALQTATEQAKKINDTALNDKMLLVREAELQAEGIALQFAAEADVYSYAREALNLTSEGLLAYVGSRAVGGAADGRVDIALSEPGRSQYRDEL